MWLTHLRNRIDTNKKTYNKVTKRKENKHNTQEKYQTIQGKQKKSKTEEIQN